MRVQLLAAFTFATLTGLSACGGTTDNGSPGGGQPQGAGSNSGGTTKSLPANPIQLTVDACTLVTQAEATAALGVPATGSRGSSGFSCNYTGSGSEHLIAVDESPEGCALALLPLQGKSLGRGYKLVDLGDGGVQFLGAGKVQFVKSGGCVSIEGARGTLASGLIIPDDVILGVARTAAGRVP